MYGSGYGSALAGAGITTGLSLLLTIVAFVLSIIVYIKLAGAKADKVFKASWSWRGFFSFDTFMVSGILKYLYILSAFEIVAFGLSILIGSMVLGGALGLLGGIFGSLTIIAFGELLCRVMFEFMMLSVKLTENSSIIKNVLVGGIDGSNVAGNGFGDDVFTAGAAMPPQVPSPVPASVDPFASSFPASATESWTCPNCGRKNAKGSFCAGCGGPRA